MIKCIMYQACSIHASYGTEHRLYFPVKLRHFDNNEICHFLVYENKTKIIAWKQAGQLSSTYTVQSTTD